MIAAAFALILSAPPSTLYEAPAGNLYAKVVPGGTTILPNGRFLTPLGKRLYTGENCWNVVVHPNGRTFVALSEGSLIIYPSPNSTRAWRLARGTVTPPAGWPQGLPVNDFAPAGAFSKDGSRFIVSNGEGGGVSVLSTENWDKEPPANPDRRQRFENVNWQPLLALTSNGGGVRDAYINDLVLDPGHRYVYAADVAVQRLVIFDLEAGKVAAATPAGRQPYALTLSGDGKRVFVANIGIFDYSVVQPPAAGSGGSPRGLSVPAFSFPSREAEIGKEMEGRQVPGLGKPQVIDAQSIFAYDVSNPTAPKLLQRAKAGILIQAPAEGGKAVGGSAPNRLLERNGRLYVANANNDTVQVFDSKTLRSLRLIKLQASRELARYRGVIPSGLAMNPAGNRLYVSEAGLNAIGVYNPATGNLVGRIPTGWFPTQFELSRDGKALFIANQKGLGRGPRGPKTARAETDERFGLVDMPGMVQVTAVPDTPELQRLNRVVLQNNGIFPVTARRAATPSPMPRVPGKPSDQIKYVVFITKENHTFDGIFGELKARGAVGEPDYAEFGSQGWIQEKGRGERLPIMPNHIKLANEFAISDNFYMEPQASGDGHRWLVGVYPSLWTTRVFYSGWDFRLNNNAKGRLVSFGSNGSQIPEDYLENGSIWEHLARNGISFRNYGEGYELPHNDEGWMTNRAGGYTLVNYPMPKVLFDNTDFRFPSYNTNIPDIARADWFIEDIETNYRKKGRPFPRFINIAICNDHGDRAVPERGYPFVCSYMADNDLALGRIVEYLSKQPEWKNMAIFVTQDDPGGDNDHIDRHRSFVLAISPYARRGYISKRHTSIMSIIKSIYLFYGMGPNNLFDALATDLSDMFTMRPDFTPYSPVMTDPRVFKPEDTFDPTDPKFERRRREAAKVKMDDPRFLEWMNERGRIKQ